MRSENDPWLSVRMPLRGTFNLSRRRTFHGPTIASKCARRSDIVMVQECGTFHEETGWAAKLSAWMSLV